MLEQHTKASTDIALKHTAIIIEIKTEQTDNASRRSEQAEHFAQQRRFAASRPPQQANHLPGFNSQIQITMNALLAKNSIDAAKLNYRRLGHS
jgi:hypothetical protein